MTSVVKFAKTSVIYFLGNTISKLAMVFLLPLYTRYIPQSDYGYYDLTVTYLTVITTILFIEIWSGILRFIFDYKEKSGKYSVAFNGLFVFAVSFVFYGILAFILRFWLHIDYYWLIFLYGLLVNLQNVYGCIARGLNKSAIFAISGLVSTVVMILVNTVLLIYYKLDYSALYISSCIGIFIQLIILESAVKLSQNLHFKLFDWEFVKVILKYSFPLSMNSLCYWFLSSFNRIVIANKLSISDNGAYAVAGKITLIINLLAFAFSLTWQEMVYSIEGDEKQRGGYYSKANDIYVKFLGVGMVGCLPVIFLIFPFMVDKSYSGVKEIIPLFLLATVISIYSTFLSSLFAAIKRTNITFVSTIVASIINVAIIYLIIDSLRLNAPNIALILGLMVGIAIRIVLLKRIAFFKMNYLYPLVIALFYAGACLVYYKAGILGNALLLLTTTIVGIYIFKDYLRAIFSKVFGLLRNGDQSFSKQ